MKKNKKTTTGYPANRAGKQRLDAKKIKAMVGDEWIDMLVELAPNLVEACGNVGKHAPCPVHGGEDGFRMYRDSPETGGGICNTCGSFSDGFALLQWVNDWSFPETLDAVAEYLGLEPTGDDQPEKSSRKGAKHQSDPNVEKKIQRILDGTVHDEEHRISSYLESRGLSGKVPFGLHYHPALHYYEDGEKVGEFEAMVAMFTREDDEVVSILQTYLAPDGPGKADVQAPKKMHKAVWAGATRGAAIRLSEPEKLLGFAEGIETALAVEEAVGTSMWATGSAGGMEKVDLPDVVDQVEIWCDNDPGGVGQKAGYKLMLRLLELDVEVKLLLPPEPGKDWLDVLNEHGPGALQEAQKARTLSR